MTLHSRNDWPDPPRTEQEDPPSLLGAGQTTPVHITTTAEGAPGGFINQQAPTEAPLINGCELWSLCIGRRVNVESPIEEMLQELESEGGQSGALLKALAELQSIMRSLPAGTLPDAQVSIPAWHAVLLLQIAMRKLS